MQVNNENESANAKYLGYYAVEITRMIVINTVKELLRIADRKQAMVDCVKKNF